VSIGEWRQIILNKIASSVLVSFGKDMMKHLTHLDFAIFKKDSETVMNTFTKSLQGLEKFNRFVLGSLMSNIIEIVIVSLMLYGFLGPKYFLNTICTYSIYMYLTKQLSDRRKVLLKEKWKADVNTENKIHDIVHNIDTVKYFQQENRESENFSHIVQGVREKDQKVIKSLANLNSVQNLVISLGMLINLGMGIFDCYSGLMTPGDLVMLQAIFAQIILPLNFMGMLMREVEETKVNLQYAINMINEKEKSEQTNKVMMNNMFNFTSGKIEFENVSFGFHPGKLIMNKMNLVFEPNTVNGIVGFSGQGKSTLFCLLYRLYEPQSGRILVDNQEISKVNLDSLRKVNTFISNAICLLIKI
jgi:ABC-type transport system involved in Fe-S cluster assembly fused permease/ATPase subunit